MRSDPAALRFYRRLHLRLDRRRGADWGRALLLLSLCWTAADAAFGLADGASAPAAHAAAASLPRPQDAFAERLKDARRAYFADLEGTAGAADQARQQFTALGADWPNQPVVDAYLGSLDLLDSARTLAVWRKHALAEQGLEKLDGAVNRAPENLEARFVRALTTWHLPFFFHRREQAEQDLGYLAPRAEQAARQGSLPAPLASAALDYWGQVLAERNGRGAEEVRRAFEAAVRVDPGSPGGQDARKRLGR